MAYKQAATARPPAPAAAQMEESARQAAGGRRGVWRGGDGSNEIIPAERWRRQQWRSGDNGSAGGVWQRKQQDAAMADGHRNGNAAAGAATFLFFSRDTARLSFGCPRGVFFSPAFLNLLQLRAASDPSPASPHALQLVLLLFN